MRNFVFAAAMAAMVCVIGCNRLSTTGPQGHPGSKGEKGDKGDPGDTTAYGKDCEKDAECGNAGKCGSAKFCRSADSDDLTTKVRKRRTEKVEQIQVTLRVIEGELAKAEELCMDSPSAECGLTEEATRRMEAGKKALARAEKSLALVTPASKPEELAKADDKAAVKKDEKLATAKKPAGKKPSASVRADAAEDLKTEVNLLTGKVGDLEGRTEGIEDNQKTLFGKTSELVVAVGELGRKIEAKPEASPVKPSGDRIFNYRRFASCVKAREVDIFVGEGRTAEDRKTKIENDCRAKQAG